MTRAGPPAYYIAMAIRVDTTISLRSEFGVTFGHLLRAAEKQLLLESETRFRPGSQVEFHLDLGEKGTTIYGMAQVTRVTAQAEGPSRYLLTIQQISAKDRALFQDWLYELAQAAGTPSHGSAPISATISERMDSRIGGGAVQLGPGPAQAPLSRPAPDPAAARLGGSSISDARRNVGRAAVRDALRARFAAQAGGSQADPARPERPAHPSQPPLPPPVRQPRSADAEAEFSSKIRTVRPDPPQTRTAGGGQVSVTHSPEAERQFSARRQVAGSSTPTDPSRAPAQPAAPARGRLEVRISLEAQPPEVRLVYHDQGRFLRDYGDYLSKAAAFVRCTGARPDHRGKVLFVAQLPSGAELRCDGEVVALLPSGFGLKLALGDGDEAVLAAEARISG